MRGAKLVSRAVRSAKRDRDVELAARHGEHVRCVIHDLIKRNEGKTERHELDNRPQPNHGGADAQARKTVLANRGIDDALRSEAIEQALAHFVSAVVLRDFFAHEEDIWIALQFNLDFNRTTLLQERLGDLFIADVVDHAFLRNGKW